MAYASPADEFATYVKRVVGLPGDTLAMINGTLQLNGRRMPEAYAWNADTTDDPGDADFDWQRKYVVGPPSHDTAHYTPSRDNWGPIALPPGKYFVLGDNRDNSNDSRYGGFVPARDILGEPRRVYFSRDSAAAFAGRVSAGAFDEARRRTCRARVGLRRARGRRVGPDVHQFFQS